MVETRVTVLIKLKGSNDFKIGSIIDYDKDAGRISCYLLDMNDKSYESHHLYHLWLSDIKEIDVFNMAFAGSGDTLTLDQLYSLPPIRRPLHVNISG